MQKRSVKFKLDPRSLPKAVKGIKLSSKKNTPNVTSFVKGLKVGESFLVSNLSKAQNYFRVGKLNKVKFAQRRVDSNSETLRLWRVQ